MIFVSFLRGIAAEQGEGVCLPERGGGVPELEAGKKKIGAVRK